MASKYTFRGVADMSQHDAAIKQSASEIYKYQKQAQQAEKELQRFQKESKTTAGALNTIGESLKKGNIKGALIGAEGAFNKFGSQVGITSNLTSVFTSKIGLATAGISAAIAIVTKATHAWMEYNSELNKQDKITTVTTGLSGAEAEKLTDTARALSDTYNVDFRDSINAANTLMTQFGITGEEAINIIKDGMQGMIIGDGGKLLNMIQQYAPSFRDAGISASQLVAVIHNTEGGIFTDENMNAIVMGIKNIRLMKDATKDALRSIGVDGDAMIQQLNDGTITIFQALQQVMGALNGTSKQSQAAGEVMQNVFGRQGVTAGQNLSEAILTLNTNLEETKTQTGELGNSLAELQTANENLNVAIREAFAVDGIEAFTNHIKSKLISALAEVVRLLSLIKLPDGTPEIKDKYKQKEYTPLPKQDFSFLNADGTIKTTNNKGGGTSGSNKSKGGGGRSKVSNEIKYAENSVGWLEQRISDLQKKIKLQVDASEIDKLQAEIKKTKEQLELLTNGQTINTKEITPIGSFTSAPKAQDKIETGYNPLEYYNNIGDKINNVIQLYDIGVIGADKAKEFIDSFNEQLAEAGLKPIEIDLDVNKSKEYLLSTLSEIGRGFQDAAAMFEVPELNAIGILAQAVATYIMGWSQATAEAAKLGPIGWAAFGLSTGAQMLAMVAQIKNAASFAEGGIIQGRTSIGDFNIARVNDGEMILNGRQQQSLFNLIDGNRATSNVTVNGEWKLKGQDLYMSMRNYGKGQQKLGNNIGLR